MWAPKSKLEEVSTLHLHASVTKGSNGLSKHHRQHILHSTERAAVRAAVRDGGKDSSKQHVPGGPQPGPQPGREGTK